MSMDLIHSVTEDQLRKDLPSFGPGDRVKVWFSVIEGDKERVQPFEGYVIRIRRHRISSTFTVRKVSYGIGVERIFPLHSPKIKKLEVLRRGKVRRAKLYYLRKLRGKAARIKERRYR